MTKEELEKKEEIKEIPAAPEISREEFEEKLERDSLHMSEEHIKEERALFEARIASQRQAPGRLDPRSGSWLFVQAWAFDKMNSAREKNDHINKDVIQTAVLRGEIKILKELINLPNPKSVKGLLEED